MKQSFKKSAGDNFVLVVFSTYKVVDCVDLVAGVVCITFLVVESVVVVVEVVMVEVVVVAVVVIVVVDVLWVVVVVVVVLVVVVVMKVVVEVLGMAVTISNVSDPVVVCGGLMTEGVTEDFGSDSN